MIASEPIARLRNALGTGHVRVGEATSAIDPGWHPDNLSCGVVVTPGSTDEVSAVLTICREHGLGIVPHGGRTGLVGGAISSPGQVVLSLARMNRIVDLDPVARVAVVETGVTLEALQQASIPHRLEPGIDIPSRSSATIGGMVSSNAGGIMAFRNGVMRHQVLGLEVVLPDGSICSDLTRVVKNSAGYDLKQLFIGAEGTLGVVTRVVLKLDVMPSSTVTALFGLPSVTAVLDMIRSGLETRSGTLRAAEAMWRPFFRLTAGARGFSDASVDDAPVYLLLMLGGADEAGMREAFERLFEEAYERYSEVSGVVATSARQERDVWLLREDTDALYHAFPAAPSYDVSLPVSAIEEYVPRMLSGLRAVDPSLDPFVFGHLADGNLHVVLNHAGPLPREQAATVESVLYADLAGLGGSFSAEHGIGSKRIHALRDHADPVKFATMTAIKRMLDERGLMNPGKVLPI